MPEGRDTNRIYNWKPKKRRPPGRPRKRWEDQIREITQREQRDFEEVKNLTQDRVAWRNLTQRLTTDRPEGLQASGMLSGGESSGRSAISRLFLNIGNPNIFLTNPEALRSAIDSVSSSVSRLRSLAASLRGGYGTIGSQGSECSAAADWLSIDMAASSSDRLFTDSNVRSPIVTTPTSERQVDRLKNKEHCRPSANGYSSAIFHHLQHNQGHGCLRPRNTLLADRAAPNHSTQTGTRPLAALDENQDIQTFPDLYTSRETWRARVCPGVCRKYQPRRVQVCDISGHARTPGN
ncbi:hypothetical protein Bbelb_118190 [Branchiostoma belcheri]|nr:hypothetical protein Bbelb_118190 [Branchiostoma belcheri]